ncbi:MAG: AAA domain-containing protein [Bacteroidota bacterium]
MPLPALLQDYNHIESHLEDFDLPSLFGKGEKLQTTPTPGSYIKEEDRYFVTPVDQSQEAALLKIKAGNSLVIHGPPGTGKSQVIVNIMADAMAHGKKVLLVSQKRAALDVVYKRMHQLGLSRFAVLVHDYRHDRAEIYQKIKNQIDDLETFQREIRDLNITQWEHEYKLISRQTDQLSRDFESLFEALTERQTFGLTVHELYLKSDRKEELFPFTELAKKLDQDKLEALIEKLGVLYDYAEFFEKDYPWNIRLSFRHYGREDQERITALLEKIPLHVEQLHLEYLRLNQQLGSAILDSVQNAERIGAFRKVDAHIHVHRTRQDMEAIHKEKHEVEKLRILLEKFEAAIDGLEERRFLDDGHWLLYNELIKYLDAYKKFQNKSGKLFRLDYQRARWFWRKICKQQNHKLDKLNFGKIRREVTAFRKMHQLYSKHMDDTFLEDFPLLDTQAEKDAWLHRKKASLEAYAFTTSIHYFPKHKPRFSYGKFEQEKWHESMMHIQALENFNTSLKDFGRDWNRYFHPDQIQKLQEGIKDPDKLKPFFNALSKSFREDFQDLHSLDKHLASFSTTENQLLEVIRPELHKDSQEEDVNKRIRQSFYFYWIEQTERKYPILSEVSGRGWNRKTQDYRKKLSQRRKKVSELILRRLKENIISILEFNRLKNPITYRQIHHQVSKKRRLWSVRKLVNESWESGLQKLMPCWMASPESVSAIFPMQKDFFDVVIFDEASQCFVERAIPVMLRAKQSVIAGDEKQLQPLDLYKVKYEDVEAEFVEDEIALEVESILDLAKTSLAESQLSWHYRSQEEALINFSNQAFYEGKLQLIPPAKHDPLSQPPLQWISVEGVWENNRNEVEARKVIELVLKLVQREDKPSIGIVTFNFHQQELIKDLLDRELEFLSQEDKKLFNLLQASMQKSESEEYQGLFVKNIENVQGDERDIIIFSIAYAKNKKGKFIANFGLLNQAGGENRLNVAISRARKMNYVICSFLPNELNVEQAAHAGPRYLKQYLQYVRAISDAQEEVAFSLLNSQNAQDLHFMPPNQIADYIAVALAEKGYRIQRNLGDTRFKLDIAVLHPDKEEEYLLGIECEGSQYFRGESAKEREVYRPDLLSAKSWKLYRVWARNFWLDKEKEVEKILALLS